MNKAEQIKTIKVKSTLEKLLKVQEQQNKLRAKINPLGELLENITATQKAFQLKSPFVELAKNPLLEQITASINSPILKLATQNQQLADSLRGNHWTETILRLNDILPKVDLPKWNLPNYKPLYEYGLRLQGIQTAFATPEIVKSFQSIHEYAEKLEAKKTEAENNYYHQITVEDYKFKATKSKDKITELEQKIIELERNSNEYLTTIKTLSGLVAQPKNKKQPAQTLRPNIEVSQIVRLHNGTKGIFEATPEQWRTLFSDTEIQLIEPIKAVAVADIAVLFYHLHDREFVETSKYPSILERAKAFSINGKTVTAKQINKPKSDNYNFPYIGKNYDSISKAVASL